MIEEVDRGVAVRDNELQNLPELGQERPASGGGRFYTEDEIVELVMVIALANMVNRFNDTLQIEPDLG